MSMETTSTVSTDTSTTSSSASESHNKPMDGSTCMSCWEDLDENIYVEYRYILINNQISNWKPSGYCQVSV